MSETGAVCTEKRRLFRRGKRQWLFLIITIALIQGIAFAYAAEPVPQIKLTDQETAWLKEHPVIRLAPDPFYPPFEFFDEKGGYRGIAADYMSILEKRLNIRFEVMHLKNWNEIIEKAKKRDIDMFGAANRTSPRSEYMIFTSPYLKSPTVILVRDEVRGELTVGELKNRKIGVIENYARHDYFKTHYPEYLLEPVPDMETGLRDLLNGRVDVLVADIALATHYIQKMGISNLRVAGELDISSQLRIAVRKDWPVLRDIFEKGLASISEKERSEISSNWIGLKKKEGGRRRWGIVEGIIISLIGGLLLLFIFGRILSAFEIEVFSAKIGRPGFKILLALVGIIAAIFIYQRFISDGELLTAEEKKWMKRHPVIRVGPDPNFPPVEYFDEKGKLRGMVTDYYRLLEESLGIRFQVVQCNDWNEVIEKTKKGQIDVYLATKTPDRSLYMLFTPPAILFPGVIISKEGESLSLAQLQGRKVAVVQGYVWEECITRDYPEVEVVPVPDLQVAIRKVAFGELDAMVANLATATYYIEKEGITNLHVAGESGYYMELAFASRRDWPVFNGILAKGVARISQDEKDAILYKWIHLKHDRLILSRKFWLVVGAASLGIIAVFSFVLAWNMALKKEVGARTMELENELLERQRTEEELGRLRNLLSSIINSMPSVLIGVDSEGRVTQWNREAEKATGLDAVGAQGRILADVFPRLSAEMEKVREAIKGRRSYRKENLMHENKGVLTYSELTVYPLVANGIEGAVIRVDDVSDQVHIKEMMIQSEKMISVGGLAAGMAHEINNPLAGIIQNMQVIQNRMTGDLPKNRKAAEECGTDMKTIEAYMVKRGLPDMFSSVVESGKRAARIVDNMLSFSRKSDHGHFQMEDVRELLDKSVELCASDYDLKKKYDFRQVEIMTDYDPDMPEILCEGAKIQQVFMNILKNGAQAMAKKEAKGADKKSRFVLRISKEEGYARIEIEDNGPGMEEHIRRRIFEPFFTTKEKGAGTGLGLSVSYFIITEDHQGTLAVESVPGKGAKFIIRLPFKKKIASAAGFVGGNFFKKATLRRQKK